MSEARDANPNGHPRISVDPQVCHGRPVIAGTRVPVEVILSALGAGDPADQVADDYGVTPEDVQAAVAYAGALLASELHFPIRAKAS